MFWKLWRHGQFRYSATVSTGLGVDPEPELNALFTLGVISDQGSLSG